MFILLCLIYAALFYVIYKEVRSYKKDTMNKIVKFRNYHRLEWLKKRREEKLKRALEFRNRRK